MINLFINRISINSYGGGNILYFHGDGHGDFETMSRHYKSDSLLEDYETYLNTQLEYVRMAREKESQI